MTEQHRPPFGYMVSFECALAYGLGPIGVCDWGDCDRGAWGMRWDGDTSQYLTVCEHCARTYDPSMAAQFERLQEAWNALVASLPFFVRVFGSMIGPYGLRMPGRRK